MKPSVYLETTIISYLVGWLNRNDLQVAAHQEITRRWWATRRNDFDLFASSVVVDEAADGEAALAAERLQFLRDVTLLRVPAEALVLSGPAPTTLKRTAESALNDLARKRDAESSAALIGPM